jgi:hypothetical protein
MLKYGKQQALINGRFKRCSRSAAYFRREKARVNAIFRQNL